jgi:NADPH:quinone reductase-like Zn-dependent oxidoreductase
VLEQVELPMPVPAADEIRVRVRATTVSSADWRLRSLTFPPGFGPLGRLALGVRGPRRPILGSELSGEVEAVGGAVSRFKPGDAVFAFPGGGLGCHAEYRCIAERGPVAHKPQRLDWAQAAALGFGGATMLDFYRRGGLRAGERVLVNGASGAVGTAAVQLARHLGAQVTAVCSAANLEMVRAIGAHAAIDYAREDFARSGATYDIIVDTVGNAPYPRSRHALAEGGRLLLVLAGLADLLKAPWVGLAGRHKVIAGPVAERAEYIAQLAGLAEDGAFTPVIDRCYAFEDMREAHRHVDSGRKRGNVVVRVAGER